MMLTLISLLRGTISETLFSFFVSVRLFQNLVSRADDFTFNNLRKTSAGSRIAKAGARHQKTTRLSAPKLGNQLPTSCLTMGRGA